MTCPRNHPPRPTASATHAARTLPRVDRAASAANTAADRDDAACPISLMIATASPCDQPPSSQVANATNVTAAAIATCVVLGTTIRPSHQADQRYRINVDLVDAGAGGPIAAVLNIARNAWVVTGGL